MKIIFISNTRMPTEKAHGYQIAKVCEDLASAGVEVELFIPRKKNFDISMFDYYGIKNNFKVRELFSFGGAGRWAWAGRVGFYFYRFLFFMTVVFASVDKDAFVFSRSPEIVWLFNKRGRKTAYSAHNWPKSGKCFFLWLLSGADKIVCNSRGTEDMFKKHNFTNTFVITNGVDIKAFDTIVETKEKLRGLLNLPLGKKIAVYAGHLYNWKGIGVMIDSSVYLPDACFLIVGGTEKDVKKYRALTAERKLDNVIIAGHKNIKIIPKYLKAADALVLPNIAINMESEKYTSPIKMFEYMASRAPIVATNLPSIREILNEETAFLTQPGDSVALAKGLRQAFYSSEAKIKALKAYEEVKKYSWSEHAKKLAEFLNK